MCSCALWILGEYSAGVDDIESSMELIRQSLGPMPLLAKEGADIFRGLGLPALEARATSQEESRASSH